VICADDRKFAVNLKRVLFACTIIAVTTSSRLQKKDSGLQTPEEGLQAPDSGLQKKDSRLQTRTPRNRLQAPGSGLQKKDSGLRAPERISFLAGVRSPESGVLCC